MRRLLDALADAAPSAERAALNQDLLAEALCALLQKQGQPQNPTRAQAQAPERAAAQPATPASDDAFDQLFGVHPHPMMVIDVPNQRFICANEAAEAQYGWVGDEWRGLSLFDLRCAAEAARLQRFMKENPDPRRLGIWQHRRRDGSQLFVHITASPLSYRGAPARLVLAHDLTHWLETIETRELAVQALLRSEANLQSAQTLAQMGSFEFVVAPQRLHASPALLSLSGLTGWDADALEPAFMARIDARDQPAMAAMRQRWLSGGEPGELELRYWRRPDEMRWLAVRGEPDVDPRGHLRCVRGTVQDISAHKRSELALAELSERLRAASTEREEQLERQRARIAGDLHDGLGSLLTGVKLHLELLGGVLSGAAASVPGDARSPASRVVRLGEMVDDAIDLVRQVSMNLQTPALDVGLVAALGWLAEDFQLRADVACELRIDDPLQRSAAVERSVTQELFRLTQEALGNVARHAAARQVRIDLRIDGQALHLSIRDDGVGFDPHSAQGKGHYGRFGMGERALRLGAQLQWHSRPGRGCCVDLVMPWPTPEANLIAIGRPP